MRWLGLMARVMYKFLHVFSLGLLKNGLFIFLEDDIQGTGDVGEGLLADMGVDFCGFG